MYFWDLLSLTFSVQNELNILCAWKPILFMSLSFFFKAAQAACVSFAAGWKVQTEIVGKHEPKIREGQARGILQHNK